MSDDGASHQTLAELAKAEVIWSTGMATLAADFGPETSEGMSARVARLVDQASMQITEIRSAIKYRRELQERAKAALIGIFIDWTLSDMRAERRALQGE